jgi:methylated-DNA-[protein]-cysteine S-methyltransferase
MDGVQVGNRHSWLGADVTPARLPDHRREPREPYPFRVAGYRRELDTPVGSLLLAATERGLVRVAYEVQDRDQVLASLAQAVSPRILRAPARLDPVARQLEKYRGGGRRRFDVPLDFRLADGFRRSVLRHPALARWIRGSRRRTGWGPGTPPSAPAGHRAA